MPKRTPKMLDGRDMTEQEIALKAIDYYSSNEDKKIIEKKLKETRIPLEDFLREHGMKLPNGSVCSTIHHGGYDVSLNHTLKVSTVTSENAIPILKRLGFSEAISYVPVIDDEIVQNLFNAGKISEKDLSAIYETKESFAFSVKVKKSHE